MDAQAVSAALTPAALAPAIAKRLGLPSAEVETALSLLAAGAQPAFIARYRGDRVQELRIDDLERVQSEAARAVGFELRRQQLADELAQRKLEGGVVATQLAAAAHGLDLEDVRMLGRRKKRTPAIRARLSGLTPLSLSLWRHGSEGVFADAEAVPAPLVAMPNPAALNKKRKRRRKKKPAATEAAPTPVESAADDAPVEAAAEAPAGEDAPETPASDPVEAGNDAPSEAAAEINEDAAVTEEAAQSAEQSAEASAEASAKQATEPATEEPAAEEPAAAEAPALPTYDGDALAAALDGGALPEDAGALAGAQTICADFIVEHPGVRRVLRRLALKRGKLKTTVVEAKKGKAGRYTKFFDRAEACSSMAPNNVLAIHRGERDGLLTVELELDPALVQQEIASLLKVKDEGAAADVLRAAALEAWDHGGLAKATFVGVRKLLKERADRTVLSNLCEALRVQLLAPAFGRKPILCIDPGTQHGCRLVMLGADGAVLLEDTVFPLQPKLQAPQAQARIVEICTEHAAALIVVVGGTAAREVEKLARTAIAEAEGLEVAVHSVDADTASAGAKALKGELPKADAPSRRAIAAGRRVQDPLSALAKADPRKLSLGQHQYDVDQEALRQALDQVIGTCIAKVSLDLNTADADTLARIPGMSHALAKAVITHREGREAGFRSRNELLEVPGLVGKAFEQSAGFLRVFGGDQPLDATGVHPERYGQVADMARSLDITVPELIGNPEKVDAIVADPFLGTPGVSGETLGPRGLSQVQAALRQPDRDPRPKFEVAAYHPDLASFEDLKPGMELEGIVTHIANFGAFVDVGIAQEGLVHLSELSHEYVASAQDVVHIGERVKGKVLEVIPEKKRFALSLKALQPKPERPERPARSERSGRGDGGKGRRDGKGRGKGKGGRNDRGKGRGEKKEKVLGFRLDLSDLASRLGKG
ncbi:MAG: Tex-like N-terminal domain-containing protein [Myxococcota bacterium]